MAEGNFEAIKYAMRQSKDGLVISFVVQPHDVTPELMSLPIGSRMMIGWAEIVDASVQPIVACVDQTKIVADINVGENPGSAPGASSKPKRRFDELPPSQQCAITCQEPRFWEFLSQCHTDVADVIASPETAADWTRGYLGIDSRARLDADEDAAKEWGRIFSRYQSWLLSKKYADIIQ